MWLSANQKLAYGEISIRHDMSFKNTLIHSREICEYYIKVWDVRTKCETLHSLQNLSQIALLRSYKWSQIQMGLLKDTKALKWAQFLSFFVFLSSFFAGLMVDLPNEHASSPILVTQRHLPFDTCNLVLNSVIM